MQKTILKVSDVHGKLSYARDSRQTLAYMICHAQQAYVLQRFSIWHTNLRVKNCVVLKNSSDSVTSFKSRTDVLLRIGTPFLQLV